MNDSWPREPQGRELENLTQLFKVLIIIKISG